MSDKAYYNMETAEIAKELDEKQTRLWKVLTPDQQQLASDIIEMERELVTRES